MDQYITITSAQQNPAKFTCSVLDALDVGDNYEVAVTRIFHPPLLNVTERNNKFTLVKTTDIVINDLFDYYIPPGYYASSCDVLAAIYNAIESSRIRDFRMIEPLITKPPVFSYSKNYGESSSLKIMDTNVKFLIDMERDGESALLPMLGFCVDGKMDKITINHYNFDISPEPGFLYSNIVENSYINQQQSRLVSLFPVHSKKGYNYYEFVNPIYCKLSAHSFVDVNFTLNDVHGAVMSMDQENASYDGIDSVTYPTIITLHMRKIV